MTTTRRSFLSRAAGATATALVLITSSRAVAAEPEIIPPAPKMEAERGVYTHIDGTKWRCSPSGNKGTTGYIDFTADRGFMLIRVEPYDVRA